jgi:CDP-Glycerol:Poly(glycerophosphate) glycerophosphotransferase
MLGLIAQYWKKINLVLKLAAIALIVAMISGWLPAAWVPPTAVIVLVGTMIKSRHITMLERQWDAAWRWITGAPAPQELADLIGAIQPEFIFYFDGPAGSAHHVQMWYPHLTALNRKFVVVARGATDSNVLKLSGIPCLFVKRLRDLELFANCGAKTVFYANNSMRNSHMIRFHNLTHVQLLHGESDKPSSFNPCTTMFDIIFVAGELGRDRYYANGVYIDPDKFRIVSRPQCAELNVTVSPATNIETVLYAPTWRDLNMGDSVSSMSFALEVVAKLVQLGKTVQFRPHPYSYKSPEDREVIYAIQTLLAEESRRTNKPHFIANSADFGMKCATVAESINAADFLVSDMTSVLADWLYTCKPYAVIDPTSDPVSFLQANALARAGHYVAKNLDQLEKSLDVKNGDIHFSQRLKLRQYALGLTESDHPRAKFESACLDILDNFDKAALQRRKINEIRKADVQGPQRVALN